MDEIRTTELVIKEIKELVSSKGYIYALCMILVEDFHVIAEKMHNTNYEARLNTSEVSLLLGFLIQNKIDFSQPDTIQDLIGLKQMTYDLLEDLHKSLMIPFFEKMKKNLEHGNKGSDYRKEMKNFFGTGDMLMEPIFYSGSGVYDFQFLDFLERKYKYDKKWLIENKGFDIPKTKSIALKIKGILQKNSKKVQLLFIKEEMSQIIESLEKRHPGEDWEKQLNNFLPFVELYQYVELFFEKSFEEIDLATCEINESNWNSFYQGLLDLFIIKKSDFKKNSGINSFLNNFSISFQKGFNSQFKGIGNFNQINARPIIKLDDNRYFIPLSYLLFEAIYESPFYWMLDDESYKDQLAQNRGNTGEEIAYDFLSQVFGEDKTFKSVRISTKKGQDDTDIDTICFLGSKALCVQVKSKKLTEISRTGNDEQLQKDFHAAVQDAYNQGLISRNKILSGDSRFLTKDGTRITISEDIDDVFIMGITTENYPSLTHQSHIMLDKNDNDPYPIFSTIFDLELLTHYLNDPYDFMYYIRQRTSLMNYFKAENEAIFLGYHLDRKLWKIPNSDGMLIESDFGQLIDRNYYPYKLGLEVSDEGDAIINKWKNEGFDDLCNQIKTINQPQITDIIFYLLDWSGDTRKNLVDYIIKTKQKTKTDGKSHNFSIPPDDNYITRVGITFISSNSGDPQKLEENLSTLCQVRKYKSRGDVWIGLGGLKNSDRLFDTILFAEDKWVYDQEMEKLANIM